MTLYAVLKYKKFLKLRYPPPINRKNKMTNSKNEVLLFLSIFLLVCIAMLYPGQSQSQNIDPNAYYRLTTQWQGDGKSLDIINDGVNNKIQLADTGNYSGQFWKFTPLGNGYYRMTTQWQGEAKSLDVINDGKNNRLNLANTGNYSGQFWKITPLNSGYVRLTTQWQSDNKSLDVINDGRNNKLQLANTGNFSGQFWKLSRVGSVQVSPKKPVSRERVCYNMIQGKVAWDQNGSRQWQDKNINNLCAGSRNPHQTVNCFKQGIASHNDWNKAINECRGSKSKHQICYDMIQGKVAWARNGSRQWQDKNINNLCARSRNPHETVSCFKRGVAYHNDWNRAINECSRI